MRPVAYTLTGQVAHAPANAVIFSGMRPHSLLEGARLPAARKNTRALYLRSYGEDNVTFHGALDLVARSKITFRFNFLRRVIYKRPKTE